MIKDEEIQKGAVQWSDYKQLFSYAPCGMFGVVLIILLHVFINLCTMGVSLYLSYALTLRFNSSQEGLDEAEKRKLEAEYDMALLSIISISLFASFIGKWISNMIFMRINKRLHNDIVKSVLRTKLQFFEENTQGRILNRFSKDISTLDYLVFDFLEMVDYFTKCILSIGMVIIVSPWLIGIAMCSLIYLVRLRKKCV